MEILVIDDDRVLVQMLSRNLVAKGHRVTVAYDAMQATAAVMRKPPDAILLDISMPAGGGTKVLERIRSSTKTGHVPVIVLTSSQDPQVRQTVMELGANLFLQKPVEFDFLHEELCRVIGNDKKDA